jgi:carboxylate-amine ligase
MQAWLSVLLALSANSPYWRGADTGYASWRSRLWEMWPTSGPAEAFGSAEEHDAVVDRLVSWGGASDVAMVNFGTRRSAVHPTVEVRVTDVCTDVADTVVLAALVRALAATAAAEWEAGSPPLPWRAEELRTAGWLAARHGTGRTLVDPVERRTRPAGDVMGTLLSHVDRALTLSGDREQVAAGLARISDQGTGADAQRRELGRSGTLRDVALDLARRTLDR